MTNVPLSLLVRSAGVLIFFIIPYPFALLLIIMDRAKLFHYYHLVHSKSQNIKKQKAEFRSKISQARRDLEKTLKTNEHVVMSVLG